MGKGMRVEEVCKGKVRGVIATLPLALLCGPCNFFNVNSFFDHHNQSITAVQF